MEEPPLLSPEEARRAVECRPEDVQNLSDAQKMYLHGFLVRSGKLSKEADLAVGNPIMAKRLENSKAVARKLGSQPLDYVITTAGYKDFFLTWPAGPYKDGPYIKNDLKESWLPVDYILELRERNKADISGPVKASGTSLSCDPGKSDACQTPAQRCRTL